MAKAFLPSIIAQGKFQLEYQKLGRLTDIEASDMVVMCNSSSLNFIHSDYQCKRAPILLGFLEDNELSRFYFHSLVQTFCNFQYDVYCYWIFAPKSDAVKPGKRIAFHIKEHSTQGACLADQSVKNCLHNS